MSIHNHLSPENMKTYFKPSRLPHIYHHGKPIFITYRLKFPLPQQMLDDYNKRIRAWYKELRDLPKDERAYLLVDKDKRFFDWYDRLLGLSPDIPQILHQDGIREIIQESFHHFDGLRYTLLCYCIMPNHVHVLIVPKAQEGGKIFSISRIVFTWKTYTAKAINKALGQQGSLWQRECYDSLVNDKEGLAKVIGYIVNNPVAANLVEDWRDWKGTYLKDEVM